MDWTTRSITIVVVLFATGLSVEARAQADSERDMEARSLFEAGESAFRDGRYEDALERFRDAHELSGRPRLLYNIGTTAERLQRDAEALEAYEAYLAGEPEAPNRREVEARIRILRDAVAQSEVQETQSASEEEPGGYPLTWVFGSATVVATILGVTGRLVGNAEYDDLVQRCTDIGGCTDAEVEDSAVRRWDRLTVASFVVAGAGLAGALIAFFLERPAAQSEEGGLSLELGPTSVALRGTF